jgi:hypothetical protein
MTTDYRALCAELVNAHDADEGVSASQWAANLTAVIDCARTALAQPEPAGPSDEELKATYWDAFVEAAPCGADESWLAGLRAVARWGRPAIAPIPVSERLPEAGEMNDDNEVWIEEPAFDYPLSDTGDCDIEPGKWVLRRIIPLDMRNNRRWLPAHALPLPGQPAPDAPAL